MADGNDVDPILSVKLVTRETLQIMLFVRLTIWHVERDTVKEQSNTNTCEVVEYINIYLIIVMGKLNFQGRKSKPTCLINLRRSTLIMLLNMWVITYWSIIYLLCLCRCLLCILKAGCTREAFLQDIRQSSVVVPPRSSLWWTSVHFLDKHKSAACCAGVLEIFSRVLQLFIS